MLKLWLLRSHGRLGGAYVGSWAFFFWSGGGDLKHEQHKNVIPVVALKAVLQLIVKHTHTNPNTHTHTHKTSTGKTAPFYHHYTARVPRSLWSRVLPPVLHLTVCWAARRCVASAALRDQTAQLTHGQLSWLPPLISHLRRGKVKTREGDGKREMEGGKKKTQGWRCVYRRMADVKALFSPFLREADMCTIFEKVNNGSHFFFILWIFTLSKL